MAVQRHLTLQFYQLLHLVFLENKIPLPPQRMEPSQFMLLTWMGTGIWMCSPHLILTIRLPGIRMREQGYLLPNRLLPPQRFGPGQSMRLTWTAMGIWMCFPLPRLIIRLPGIRMTGQVVLPYPPHRPLPPQRLPPSQSMQPTWMGMGIWMCSLLPRMTIKLPGIRMMEPVYLRFPPHRPSPLQRMVPLRCMRPTWTGTGTWMCFLLPNLTIRLPGMKILTGRVVLE